MFKYTPLTIPHNIFLIGAGGTGSRLLPMLGQFIRSISVDHNPLGWLRSPRIFIFDNDVVERKNLLRQNFIAPDVDKNKATVLADRYSKAFGISITPITNNVTTVVSTSEVVYRCLKDLLPADSYNECFNNGLGPSLVIMAVDSVKSRQDILSVFCTSRIDGGIFANPKQTFFIDAGNEDVFGQVTLFHGASLYTSDATLDLIKEDTKSYPKSIIADADIGFIPCPLADYLSMVPGVSTRSCADLDQTLSINASMATMILSVVQNYYYRRPIDYNQLSITMDGGSSTRLLNHREIIRLCHSQSTVRSIQTRTHTLSTGRRMNEGGLSFPGIDWVELSSWKSWLNWKNVAIPFIESVNKLESDKLFLEKEKLRKVVEKEQEAKYSRKIDELLKNYQALQGLYNKAKFDLNLKIKMIEEMRSVDRVGDPKPENNTPDSYWDSLPKDSDVIPEKYANELEYLMPEKKTFPAAPPKELPKLTRLPKPQHTETIRLTPFRNTSMQVDVVSNATSVTNSTLGLGNSVDSASTSSAPVQVFDTPSVT